MCVFVKVNVMVALSMLKKLGLSADVASNGMEAIKAMQTKHYDLVYDFFPYPLSNRLFYVSENHFSVNWVD